MDATFWIVVVLAVLFVIALLFQSAEIDELKHRLEDVEKPEK